MDSLHATGSMEWPMAEEDFARSVAGGFDLSTQGADQEHQLTARATIGHGEILLADVQELCTRRPILWELWSVEEPRGTGFQPVHPDRESTG